LLVELFAWPKADMALHMSAFDPKRTWRPCFSTSATSPKLRARSQARRKAQGLGLKPVHGRPHILGPCRYQCCCRRQNGLVPFHCLQAPRRFNCDSRQNCKGSANSRGDENSMLVLPDSTDRLVAQLLVRIRLGQTKAPRRSFYRALLPLRAPCGHLPQMPYQRR